MGRGEDLIGVVPFDGILVVVDGALQIDGLSSAQINARRRWLKADSRRMEFRELGDRGLPHETVGGDASIEAEIASLNRRQNEIVVVERHREILAILGPMHTGSRRAGRWLTAETNVFAEGRTGRHGR